MLLTTIFSSIKKWLWLSHLGLKTKNKYFAWKLEIKGKGNESRKKEKRKKIGFSNLMVGFHLFASSSWLLLHTFASLFFNNSRGEVGYHLEDY